MLSDKVEAWTNYLSSEIDDRIADVQNRNAKVLENISAVVVADVVSGAGLESEWSMYLALERDCEALRKSLDLVSIKRNNMKHFLGEELEISYYGSSEHLARRLEHKYRDRIDELFLATPEGEEIAELRKLRSRIEHKLYVAKSNRKLMDAVRKIAEAAGIDVDVDLEE